MRILLIIITLVICECGYSQTFGIRFGMNKTVMDGYSGNIEYHGGGISDLVKTEKNHISFNGGIIAEFPAGKLKKRFSIESGLIIKTIGKNVAVKYSSFIMAQRGYVDQTGSGSIRLWYLSIPATGKIGFNIGRTRLSCLLGPNFNIGIGGKENGSPIIWGNTEYDHIRRLDISLSAGLALSGKKTEAGIICSRSFRDIDPSINSLYNRELSFYIRFNLHHKNKPFENPVKDAQPSSR